MTSPTPRWHQFHETEDGDDACSSCGVVVTLDAHMTFTHPCPVPPCTGKQNAGDGCVMHPYRDGPCRCLYCGRSGDRDHETVETDHLDEEVEAELEADATAQLLASLSSIASGDVLELALLAGAADD